MPEVATAGAAARSSPARGSSRRGRRHAADLDAAIAASQMARRGRTHWCRAPVPAEPPRRGAGAGAACSTRPPPPARRYGPATDWRTGSQRLVRELSRIQRGRQFGHFEGVIDKVPHEAGDGGICHRVGDGVEAGQEASVGHGGMRAVEEPELAAFEGRDVVDEVDADLGQWRELIEGSDDPGAVAFGDDGGRSRSPSSRDVSSTSCSVGAGTMRSTTELGKQTSPAIHSARDGSIRSATSTTHERRTLPLSSRLSSEAKTGAPNPARRRRASASAMSAGAEVGASEGAGSSSHLVALLRDGERHQSASLAPPSPRARRPVRSPWKPARRPPAARRPRRVPGRRQ